MRRRVLVAAATVALILTTLAAAAPDAHAVPVTGAISGHVANDDGTPAVGRNVWVFTAARVWVAATTTDAAGNYTTKQLMPGTYRVQAWDPARVAPARWSLYAETFELAADVAVTAGTTVVADIVPGSMSGTVTNGFDALAGMYVVYSEAAVPRLAGYTVTDANGAFTLPGLAPGQYRVAVIDPAWNADQTVGYLPEYFGTRSVVTFADGPVFDVSAGADTALGATTLAGHDCDPVAFAPGSVHPEDLSGAFLPGCDLDTVDFTNADLTGATLRGANLKSSYFSNTTLDAADLSGADLDFSFVSQTSAIGTNVHATKIAGFARFSGLQLTGGDATDVVWNSIDISFSNLTGTDFTGAYVGGTFTWVTCPDGEPADDFVGCQGHGIG